MMNVPYMFINNKKVDGFAEVLNTGNHRLLKHVQRTVDAKDSLFGTQKKYFFRDQVFYFMWHNEKVERIKKLNKTNILQLLPSASAYTKWINENKIDFTKEADVILFLDYYNARKL